MKNRDGERRTASGRLLIAVVTLEAITIAYHWTVGTERQDGVSAALQAAALIVTALLAYGVWRQSRASWVALLLVSAWPLFGVSPCPQASRRTGRTSSCHWW